MNNEKLRFRDAFWSKKCNLLPIIISLWSYEWRDTARLTDYWPWLTVYACHFGWEKKSPHSQRYHNWVLESALLSICGKSTSKLMKLLFDIWVSHRQQNVVNRLSLSHFGWHKCLTNWTLLIGRVSTGQTFCFRNFPKIWSNSIFLHSLSTTARSYTSKVRLALVGLYSTSYCLYYRPGHMLLVQAWGHSIKCSLTLKLPEANQELKTTRTKVQGLSLLRTQSYF